MTIREWIEKRRRERAAIEGNRILFLATTGTMAEQSVRIFSRGELTDGGTITYKEDYELYIYKPPFPRQPSGKGKTGRSIKGQWAPSYISAKASQDRGDLPFELTGDLRLAWGGGVQPQPREVSPTLCVIALPEKEAKKAEGLARQKGEFLGLTRAEIDSHNNRLRDLWRQIISP
jgi:hypothetical protein